MQKNFKMKIYSKNNVLLYDIIPDDSSVRYRSIMNDDSLTLQFSLTEHIEVPLYSYVDFEGRRYTLWKPENFKKNNTRDFEYTLTLGGFREALKLWKFKNTAIIPYQLKFTLTAKPVDFLNLLVNVLNVHDSGWSVGDCVDMAPITLSFNHEYCIDALNRLAEECKTEYEFEDKKIHLHKVEYFKDVPLALSYGKSNGFKSGVARANDGDKQPIGRLYVQGGERNIDFSKYGSKTLLLPESATLEYEGKTYQTDAEGMFITRTGNNNTAEDSYDASHIYPHRQGTVSEVIVVDADKHFYDIKDNSIPETLNYRDCRIAGEKATIKFETGALAGREFDLEQTDNDLTGYIHAERRFKIVPAEMDGYIMPGGAFVPAVGDKYAIFNINLPQSYIRDDATKTGASWDMFRECVRYFSENEEAKFQFTGELDGVWSKSRWLDIGGKIVPGGYISFSDPQFQPDGVLIRIVSIKDYINNPHKPEITLSNAPVSGSFGGALAKLEADEVLIDNRYKEMQRFSRRQWRDAKETMEMLAASMIEGFTPGASPITVQTMQLLVGGENLQFRFVSNKTNPKRVDHVWNYNAATKILTVPAGILQHLTLGITTLTPVHQPSEYRFWDMELYPSPPLSTAEKAYYLYAKCDKAGTTGTFVLREASIAMEADPDYYHFLYGILSSEIDGDRSFAPLYGFSEILPGRITTDKIVSQDGQAYFDLLNGVFGGRFTFVSNGQDTLLTDWIDLTEQKTDEALDKASKNSFTLELTPETLAIPANSAGVADLTLAESAVRVLKDGKELFPNYDESLGGRNLLLNSKTVNLYPNTTGHGTTVIMDDESETYMRVTSDSSLGVSMYGLDDSYNAGIFSKPLTDGRYTLSADIRVPVPMLFNFWYTHPQQNLHITNEWVRVSYTYDYVASSHQRNLGLNSNVGGAYIDVKNWKLEKNEISTPYTPAPEYILINATRTDHNCSSAIVGNTVKLTTLTPNQQAGYTDLEVNYGEGYSAKKRLTWVKVNEGDGIASTVYEFAISTDKVNAPTSGWSTTQPSWEQGKYLWKRSKIIYTSSPTPVYTGYSVSSEWEAVNELQIGTRNLIKNSSVKLETNAYHIGTIDLTENLNDGDEVTFKAWGNLASGQEIYIGLSPSTSDLGYAKKQPDGSYQVTFKFFKSPLYPNDLRNKLTLYNAPNAGNFTGKLDKYSLVRGNKAPISWTEAPEDIQARIDAEKARIDDISNDNKLSPAEKPAERLRWEQYYNELQNLTYQATLYGITTAKTNYENAFSELSKYLNNGLVWGYGIPEWLNDINLGITTTIVGYTYRNNWNTFFNYRDVLINAIQQALDAKAKGYADAVDTSHKNYIRNGNFLSGMNDWNLNYIIGTEAKPDVTRLPKTLQSELPNDVISGMEVKTYGNSNGIWQNFIDAVNHLEVDVQYTLSFRAKWVSDSNVLFFGHEANQQSVILTSSWVGYKKTFTPTSHANFIFYLEKEGTFQIANIQLERGNKVTAFKNGYLEEAIKGSTQINGGLILGNIMGVKDASGLVTAYLNGSNANPNLPAIAAGVNNFGADNETQNVAFYHEGTAKVGKLNIDNQGVIYTRDADGVRRFEINTSELPALSSLISSADILHTATNDAVTITSTQNLLLPNALLVPENNSKITITGLMFVSAKTQFAGTFCIIELYISLVNSSGEIEYGVASILAHSYNSSGMFVAQELNKNINIEFASVPVGEYKLKVATIITTNDPNSTYGEAKISATSMTSLFRNDIRQFLFGKNGLVGFYGSDKFFYLNENNTGGQPFISIRGSVDLPSGLGGGSIAPTGGGTNLWGRVSGAERSGSIVTVNHSIGDEKYTVHVAFNGSSSTWYFQNRTATSIQIVCSGAFDFTLVRIPY